MVRTLYPGVGPILGSAFFSPTFFDLRREECRTELFGAEEIVYETDEYAIFGSVSDEHLYQSVRSDIIGIRLNCLAQIKRVFPNGTQLMRNTMFARIQDADSKKALIESMGDMLKGSNFEYESDAIPEISGKPVYQLEIVALYQSSVPSAK